MATHARASAPAVRTQAVGGLAFIFLWSSGYIAAAYALRGSGPFTLAVLRFAGSAALIGLWLLWRRAPAATPAMLGHAAVAGVLLQAGFFGFTYAALRAGVPAAAAGLITGLMPLVTALGAALLLGERLTRSAVLGLVIGLIGAMFVVLPDLRSPGTALGYGFMLLALLALSGGTLYQKRHASALDPRLALVMQLATSLLVLLPLALLLEGFELHPQAALYGGVAWVILVNSCAGLLLYLWLLRRGGAARTAGLFYLVPPVTAVLAALALDARFDWHDALGLAVAALGVWLGQRDSR